MKQEFDEVTGTKIRMAAEWIAPIVAHLPFAGAFGLAFFLVFKMG